MNFEQFCVAYTVNTNNHDVLPSASTCNSSSDHLMALRGLNLRRYIYFQYVYGGACDVYGSLVAITINHCNTWYSKRINQDILRRLCEIAVVDCKGVKPVTHKHIYRKLGLTRGKWQYTWLNIYAEIVVFIHEIDDDVKRHINKRLNN